MIPDQEPGWRDEEEDPDRGLLCQTGRVGTQLGVFLVHNGMFWDWFWDPIFPAPPACDVLIEMFVTSISFRGTFKLFWDLTGNSTMPVQSALLWICQLDFQNQSLKKSCIWNWVRYLNFGATYLSFGALYLNFGKGFPTHYVPWSRSRRKRRGEDLGTNSSRRVLFLQRRSQDWFSRQKSSDIFWRVFFWRGITAREQLSRAVILARF